jgi:AcrR family transcriptional regulator
VEEIQRSRILQAMADEVAQRGPSSVTVARVIARAGVSRRAFYELFADIEDCLLATFDWALEQARARVQPAYTRERGWREAVRAGLAALLRFFDQNPLPAQLCIVHSPAGGPRVLERRSQVLIELREVVDRGRQRRSVAREPSPIVAEGVVGAVMAVLYTRLLARSGPGGGYAGPKPREPALIELHGQLMSLIVLPYLGANAAARELERTAPSPPIAAALPEAPSSARAMLELPQGRLTYRTVRVLRALAECPGGSNRDIAERAGIVDQGQISKILARLQDQDLVVNRRGSARASGTPNAWWLSERGKALEGALRETSVGAREEQPPAGSGREPPAGRSSGPASGGGSSGAASGERSSGAASRRRQPGNGSGARRPGT